SHFTSPSDFLAAFSSNVEASSTIGGASGKSLKVKKRNRSGSSMERISSTLWVFRVAMIKDVISLNTVGTTRRHVPLLQAESRVHNRGASLRCDCPSGKANRLGVQHSTPDRRFPI